MPVYGCVGGAGEVPVPAEESPAGQQEQDTGVRTVYRNVGF